MNERKRRIPGAAFGLGAAGLLVALAGAAGAQDEEAEVSFAQVVEELEEGLRGAAPEAVRVEVERAGTPADFGWDPGQGEVREARGLVLATRSGVRRSFGLLEARGRYRPTPEGPEVPEGLFVGLVTIGPGVVVVQGPMEPVALDLEAMEKGQAALEEAMQPMAAWMRGAPVAADELPAGITGALEATRYPHYLQVELRPGGAVDLERVWAAGLPAIAWRVRAEDGPAPAFEVAFKPE